jgi:hypothetical protein
MIPGQATCEKQYGFKFGPDTFCVSGVKRMRPCKVCIVTNRYYIFCAKVIPFLIFVIMVIFLRQLHFKNAFIIFYIILTLQVSNCVCIFVKIY